VAEGLHEQAEQIQGALQEGQGAEVLGVLQALLLDLLAQVDKETQAAQVKTLLNFQVVGAVVLLL
jgi:uncharacterized membrane protein YqiK